MSKQDADLLQNTPLFGSMPIDALERLAEKAVSKLYARGEVIFREEDSGDALCVVVAAW